MYKVKNCVNEKKKKERHIQTDILISYVVWEGQVWCEIVYQKVLTSRSLPAIWDKHRNKNTRIKIEEIPADTVNLGSSVQKCVCWLSVNKITVDCLSRGIDLRYITYTFTNCLLKKILKILIITLKGHLAL